MNAGFAGPSQKQFEDSACFNELCLLEKMYANESFETDQNTRVFSFLWLSYLIWYGVGISVLVLPRLENTNLSMIFEYHLNVRHSI